MVACQPILLQLEGFEPTRFITIVLKTQEKASKPHDFKAFGGLEGDRTLDLRVANAALSQAVHKATRTPRQKFELFTGKG